MVNIRTSCFNNQCLFILYLWFCVIISINSYYSLNSINQLIFVMVKCSVLFEVRTEYFFPVPVCPITAPGVPDGTFVSMHLLVPCAGD
jgi:hypothetical protein